MIRNYLTVLWRQLKRGKVYAGINVISLAAALTCCSIIGLYLRHELSYDRFHEHADRIFRVTTNRSGLNEGHMVSSPAGIGTVLNDEFPEVAAMTSLSRLSTSYVSAGERTIPADGFFFADSAFFDVFSYPLIYGDPETALDEPNGMIISADVADLLFPGENPLGNVVAIGDWQSWVVTGVAAQHQPSHFNFRILARPPAMFVREVETIEWYNSVGVVYVRLADASQAAPLEAKINVLAAEQFGAFVEENPIFASTTVTLALQPLTDIHLRSHLEYEFEINGDIRYVYLLGTLAVLLLVVAIINFINLATARYVPRAREVGVRKVLGAHRLQLIRQFLGESILVSLLAGGLALIMVMAALPVVESFTGKTLSPRLTDGALFLLLTLGLGLLAGGYPAFFLSHFQPAATLKGVFRSGRKDLVMRRVLVGLQLVATVGLATGAAVIYLQLRYLQEARLGFDKEHVLVIDSGTYIGNVYDAFKSEVLRDPAVASVTTGYRPGESSVAARLEDKSSDGTWHLHRYEAGYDYFETLGIRITEGRAFSPDFPSDASDAVMLTEAAVRKLGLEAPVVGQELKLREDRAGKTIIGVVEDFNVLSYREPTAPVMITYTDGARQNVLIKLRPGDVREALARIEQIYESFSPGQAFRPDQPIMYTFLDDEYDALFREEQRFGTLFSAFSLVAVLVAFLGLVGLAAFSAERRTKEIGVRRVLGARVSNIVLLLTSEFVKLVVAAAAISIPAAYLVAVRWLEDFAFRVEIGAPLFLGIAGAALGLVLLAVTVQAVRAAVADPVKTLRVE